MKTFLTWQKLIRELAWLKVYWVELYSEAPKMGLTMKYKLKVEPDWLLDNVNAALIDIAQYRLEDTPMFYKQDGKEYLVDKYQLATLVADCMFSAIEKVSEEGKDAFVCYIDEAKDQVREYMKENKQYMEQLQEMMAESEKVKKQKNEFDTLLEDIKQLKQAMEQTVESVNKSPQSVTKPKVVSSKARTKPQKAEPKKARKVQLWHVTLDAYNPDAKRKK